MTRENYLNETPEGIGSTPFVRLNRITKVKMRKADN